MRQGYCVVSGCGRPAAVPGKAGMVCVDHCEHTPWNPYAPEQEKTESIEDLQSSPKRIISSIPGFVGESDHRIDSQCGVLKNPTTSQTILSQAHKGDLSLLPGAPLNALALAMAAGNEKYERDDWQREDFDKREYAGKALRHIFEWLGGKRVEEESGQSPLAHAADDLLYIIWHELNGTGVNGPEAAE